MNIVKILLVCTVGFGWLVTSAHDLSTPACQCPCEKENQSIEAKKANASGIDLSELVAEYEKYQVLMNQLGLSHEKSSSGFGKFLTYIACPAAFGSFWVSMFNLLGSESKFDMSDNQARIACCVIGTAVYLMFLYAGDYFQNSDQKVKTLYAKMVLAKFVKTYEEDRTLVPKELQPIAELLKQSYLSQDEKVDLEDRLLVALLSEIDRKHTATK